MRFEIFVILLLFLCFIMWMVLKMARGTGPDDSSDDGGIDKGEDLPDLDLPPGVCLPMDRGDSDDRFNSKKDKIFS